MFRTVAFGHNDTIFGDSGAIMLWVFKIRVQLDLAILLKCFFHLDILANASFIINGAEMGFLFYKSWSQETVLLIYFSESSKFNKTVTFF